MTRYNRLLSDWVDVQLLDEHWLAVYYHCQGRLTDRPAVSWLHDRETIELPINHDNG